jgi:hypothetical protein
MICLIIYKQIIERMDTTAEKALSIVLMHDREWRLKQLEEENSNLKTKIHCITSYMEEFERTFELAKQHMHNLTSHTPRETSIEMKAFALEYRSQTNFMLNFNVLEDIYKQQKKTQTVLQVLKCISYMKTNITCETCRTILTRSVINPFSVTSSFYNYQTDNLMDFDINVYVYNLPDLTLTMTYEYWKNELSFINESIKFYRIKLERYERTVHSSCTLLKPKLFEIKTNSHNDNPIPISIEELIELQTAIQKKTLNAQLKETLLT